MHITKLNQNQGLRAGIVFLNMLGIQVVPQPIYTENKVSYPLLFNNKQSGYMTLKEQIGEVSMEIDNDEIYLIAHYEIPTVSGMKDEESGIKGYAFVDWNTNIGYKIKTKENLIINGTSLISSSADVEYGKHCSVYSTINVYNSVVGDFSLKIKHDGYDFCYSNRKIDELKEIVVKSISDNIYHEVLSQFDEDDNWNNRVVHGVTRTGRDKKVRIYDRTYNKKDKSLSVEKPDIEKEAINSQDYFEQLIQLGNEMRNNFPEMSAKIKQIRKMLKLGNISLLDSLIKVGFREDNVIEAIFGFLPKKINWQNGADNLTEAYFGDYSTSFSALQSGESEFIK